MAFSAGNLLREARQRAGLNQRELAKRAGTAQSVVARIELGLTSPSWDTLSRLLEAAGFSVMAELDHAPSAFGALLDEADRIRALSAADRLREMRNVERFLAAARRV